jgi:ABC-type transport system substrate-binding protein
MHSRRNGRNVAVVVLVAVLAAPLAGCSALQLRPGTREATAEPSAVAARPEVGGRLVYGLESDPSGLDPTRNAWDSAGIQLANALFDPLAAYDAQGRPQPYLAESFTANGEFTSWAIRLRPDVRFSNGDPFDAAALAGYLNSLRRSVIAGPLTQQLTDVRAADPRTVQITTSRPWASLPALVTGQLGYVVSPRQLADPEGHSHPIGTGPFTLRRWDIGKKFELVRNPNYWRAGLPYLDAVDFLVVPDGAQRIAMIERGELDATALTAPNDLRRLDDAVAQSPGLARFQVERDGGDAEKSAVMFNTAKPPLDDVRVRRAIAYATDVAALAEQNHWSADRLARGPIDPSSPYFSAAAYPGNDIDRARALLRDYLADPQVHDRPAEVAFTLIGTDAGAAVMNQLVNQWARAGIRARVTNVDLKRLVRLVVVGDYEASAFRYFAAPDPDVLWPFFVADTITPRVSLNFARLRNDDITNGMNDGRSTADVEARKRAYARVQKAFADQLPYLWLQRSEWRVTTTAGVRDAHNVSLPDGHAALPLLAGTHRLTETWLDR